ncbi:MAG: transcription termination factor NusA [Candidatus Babeliales bacterium]
MKLSAVIDELVEERGLDRAALSNIICEGMLAAYQKKYPTLVLQVIHNKKTDEIEVSSEKEVVNTVEDEDRQISVRKARGINKDIDAGEKLWVPFDGGIGRIEILRAKQVIANKIRTIEAEIIYNEFKNKEGTIVNGMIHKCERGGVVVKLQDTLAFLPKSLTIPTDKCIVGYPIRALLKEVLIEPRNENQLILDRASEVFLAKLFELEIPEVFEKLVEIKKIVRTPGYKAKVAVISNDSHIDPVGTCVGVGGARIKPILKEIGGEKIDVIPWSDSLEVLIKNALKPADIKRVELISDEQASVWLDEDQRSLAIGKMGQNISLASRLTGVNINLMPNATGAGSSHDDDNPIMDIE